MCDLISVIVPIYNVEKYIRKCVDSIIHQTYKNLEIILVDDGSPDNCGKICDEYALKDNRIRVIHKANGGLSDARNAGLEIMHGKYVAFVDSDDWIEPEMYQKLYDNMLAFNADMSFGGVTDDVVDESEAAKSVKISSYGGKNFSEDKIAAMKRYFHGSWAAWDKLYRAILFENVRFPAGEINEDEAIVLHLLEQCERVCYTNEVFYHYIKRAGSGSITAAKWHEKKLAWCDHCKNNLEYVKSYYPELISDANQRYMSSIMWALNNMTADVHKFSDLIPVYRQKLRECMKNADWKKEFTAKERLRAGLLAHCYYVFAMGVKLFGKKYT